MRKSFAQSAAALFTLAPRRRKSITREAVIFMHKYMYAPSVIVVDVHKK